jgi:hypothetical protein
MIYGLTKALNALCLSTGKEPLYLTRKAMLLFQKEVHPVPENLGVLIFLHYLRQRLLNGRRENIERAKSLNWIDSASWASISPALRADTIWQDKADKDLLEKIKLQGNYLDHHPIQTTGQLPRLLARTDDHV